MSEPVIAAQSNTFIDFEDRAAESPFVEKIWRCHSESGGRFLSIAASNFEMAVSRIKGKIFITLRGPETRATTMDCPAEGDWLGIRFKLGTFMPNFRPGSLRDQNDVTLPGAANHSFWLDSSAWPYPNFENAETFVNRLVKKGLIHYSPVVGNAVRGEVGAHSARSVQRHFLRSTGITHAAYRQIERARYATNLLRAGTSILDTVHEAGYFDQAHLTRSLKYLIGQTPAKIIEGTQQLSFLYKTDLPR